MLSIDVELVVDDVLLKMLHTAVSLPPLPVVQFKTHWPAYNTANPGHVPCFVAITHVPRTIPATPAWNLVWLQNLRYKFSVCLEIQVQFLAKAEYFLILFASEFILNL
jgi:hypothetical protein